MEPVEKHQETISTTQVEEESDSTFPEWRWLWTGFLMGIGMAAWFALRPAENLDRVPAQQDGSLSTENDNPTK